MQLKILFIFFVLNVDLPYTEQDDLVIDYKDTEDNFLRIPFILIYRFDHFPTPQHLGHIGVPYLQDIT